jgi:uncharacterized heparinase superfamily protein
MHELEAAAERGSFRPPGIRRSLDRAIQILRYYRASQLIRRALGYTNRSKVSLRRAARAAERSAFRDEARSRLARLALCRQPRGEWSACRFQHALDAGNLTLLNEQHALGIPIDWKFENTPKPSRLWRFHLHYQEYLLDLAVTSDAPESWALIWQIVESWIDNNPLNTIGDDSDAWHPYCISRRLAVWLQLYGRNVPPSSLLKRFRKSCVQQAEALCHSLEFDLGGNHLIENIRALVLAGCALDCIQSKKWLSRAYRSLRRELPRQVLPHGEHFERAPGYHCQVLGGLLQIMLVSADVHAPMDQLCREYATRMITFLHGILHPDGEIPLFGDSCFGDTYPVAELQRLTEATGLTTNSERSNSTKAYGPYWVWRCKTSPTDALIFDAGQVAADCLPAHGHCDLLNFEASIDGNRWIVDSGVFNYDDDPMRVYCRSTVAHNTVTIDDLNQCDVWSRFRMGYRGRTSQFRYGAEGGYSWATASHNAYRRIGVEKVDRLFVIDSNSNWFCLDHVNQAGVHSVTGRLHLSPDVEVSQLEEANAFELRQGISRRILRFVGNPKVCVESGWHCGAFGRRVATKVFCYQMSGSESNVVGWVLSKVASATPSVVIRGRSEPSVIVCGCSSLPTFEWQFRA